MPFTPYHFGPGLLFKSLFPRKSSFTAFVLSQVVIDCETLYWILQGAWPVHRSLHTFVGGAIAGVLCGTFVWLAGRFVTSWITESVRPAVWSEFSLRPAIFGGVFGGLSHSLLDGIMHPDIMPLSPFIIQNPLHNLISLQLLYLICIVSGIIGVFLLWRLQSRS